jgi:hypothetical protein
LAAGGESNPSLDLSDTAPIGNAIAAIIKANPLLEQFKQTWLGVLNQQGLASISQWKELTEERKEKYPDGLVGALDKLLGAGLCPAVYACHLSCVTYCLGCVSSAGSEDLW